MAGVFTQSGREGAMEALRFAVIALQPFFMSLEQSSYQFC